MVWAFESGFRCNDGSLIFGELWELFRGNEYFCRELNVGNRDEGVIPIRENT